MSACCLFVFFYLANRISAAMIVEGGTFRFGEDTLGLPPPL